MSTRMELPASGERPLASLLCSAQHLPRAQIDPSEDDVRLVLLRQHGHGPLAYGTLQPGVHTYPVHPSRGYVAYWRRSTRATRAFVLGDPICPAEDREDLIGAFLERERDCCFVQVSRHIAEVLARRGFHVTSMGVETELALQGFGLRGDARKHLRRARNAARRHGIIAREARDEEREWRALASLSERWLSARTGSKYELRFLLRPLVFGREPDVRKFVAVKDGHPVAFVFFDPLYAGGAVRGYYANAMRTEGPPSDRWRDFLVAEAALAFRAEGRERLSLGLSPFHRVTWRGLPLGERFTPLLLRFAFRFGERLFPFRGLAEHKERYHGGEIEVFFASRRRMTLFEVLEGFDSIGIRFGQAFSGRRRT